MRWREILLGWFAILHLAGSMLAADGQPYIIAAGPYATRQGCLAFLREFVRTYNPPLSGARLQAAYCLEPNLGERAEVSVP